MVRIFFPVAACPQPGQLSPNAVSAPIDPTARAIFDVYSGSILTCDISHHFFAVDQRERPRISDSSTNRYALGKVPFQHAARYLIRFDAFKQSFKVPFTEPIITFALDEFKEDRPDHRLAENL